MTEYVVPGLRAPVEILVDEYGVPHLYATCEDDLFMAQGFNAARERLFQMDLWRRCGLGRLAEVFGERFVARDRAARLFLYRGDMREEWAAYGADAERVVTAFANGVNAFVDLCEHRPDLLPVEFGELGYRPARWHPEDIVRIRRHGLFYNAEQEVARARTLRDHGAAAEDVRRVREPALDLRIPDGLDLGVIPDAVLDVYRLATSPPDFTGAGRPRAPGGSNNWVIGSSRTATGRPLLANDPHRAIELPSLRYIAHLSAPGLDVIGAGEPVLPGISIGHNGHLAFGLTIFPIDQEDLYVYRTNPEAPDEYWYAGGPERMRILRETVDVRDGEPVEVELRFTRHGPVVRTGHRTAFAVRAAWLEPGMAPYVGSLEYMRARDPGEFREAMSRWGAPGENQVYAAPDGTIGWCAAGRVPRRPNWDGTLPVPGDGRYEWAGFLGGDELPSAQNPPCDWIATANEMNLPSGYPHHITCDWEPRFRHDRIVEVLKDGTDLTVSDCVRLQCDTVNVAARHLLARLSPLPDAVPGLALLRSWDCDEATGSAAAALFQVWSRRHLRPALNRGRFPADGELGPNARSDLAMLDAHPDPAALLTSTLTAAWEECEDLMGEDPAEWRWGALHHVAPAHPLLSRVGLPRRERAGSGDTVMSTGCDEDFRQTTGASFRIVVDVGAWDNSRAMNAPGQSGRPGDPHWDDLYAPWSENRSFPLRYTRASVESHAHTSHRLVPPS